MSNNSWKQYGGISDLDNFNFINANTIIADQFVSRSTKPSYQYYNGTFEVSLDLSAGMNVFTGNSIYSGVDLFVNRDIYSNNKIFFGGDQLKMNGNTMPVKPADTDSAFLYGDASYIGVNIKNPKTIFNITSTLSGEIDILTVENKNDYIRNIIAQNQEQRGIVVDASNSESNIHFYVDSSTNSSLYPDATIKYNIGGSLFTNTSNEIVQGSREHRIDTSGGTIFMSTNKTQIDSCGSIILTSSADHIIMNCSGGFIFDTSSGYLLDTSGSKTNIDRATGTISIDTSGQYILHSSGGFFKVNDTDTQLVTDGSLILHSSGGFVEVDSSYGEIQFNSFQTNFNTFLNVAVTGRGLSGELYEETLTVYDNSNSQFLKNVYDISAIQTGSTMVGVGADPSANTFMRLVPATSLQGSAYGGGLYPYETSRSMNVIGLNDASGKLITNQMIIESNNKSKYTSTLGINTFTPRTEEYVVDMNGPLRIANGEVNTVSEVEFEIKAVSFSKTHPKSGIAVGSPSSLVEREFVQTALFTKDGGATWNKSLVYRGDGGLDDDVTMFIGASMYDDKYGVIAGNRTNDFYTADGGENWYQISYSNFTQFGNLGADEVKSAVEIGKGENDNTNNKTKLRVFTSVINKNNPTERIFRFFDLDINNLNATGNFTGTGAIQPSVGNQFNLIKDVSGIAFGNDYVYLAGDDIGYFNSSLPAVFGSYSYFNVTYGMHSNSYRYNDIYALNDNVVVAVGNNIISYSLNATGGVFEDVVLSTHTTFQQSMNLQSVFIKDASNIVAVGDNGSFLFTTQGPYAESWNIIPSSLANTNGMANRLTGSDNHLRSIHMIDDDTFIVSNALQDLSNSTTDSDDVLGRSKIQYTFLPYLFNRDNNRVVDVCGNILVSGNIESLDGRLYVGQNSIFNGDVSMNSRLFVAANVVFNEVTNLEKDSTLTQRLFVLNDVSLNSRLFVKENTIHGMDVSMNSRLFVADDVSMNKSLTVSENLYVTGNVNLTRFNNEYITNIETQNYSLIVTEDASFNGRLFVTEDSSLNGRLFVKNDASFNSSLFVGESIGIGTDYHPVVSFDVSSVDAIKIPRGTVAERPETTYDTHDHHAGYIRYNTENSQFEGYGPGNSWGSLGGVVNVLQNTKITAANPNPDSQNNELLFSTSDASNGTIPLQRMIIDPDGNVTIGTDKTINDKFVDTTLVTHPTDVDPLFLVSTDTNNNYTPIAQFVSSTDGVTEINRDGIYHRRGTAYFSIVTESNNLTFDSYVSNSLIYFQIGGVNKANINSSGQVEATTFNATSDARLKENIIPLEDSLQRINQLQGVNFNWIDDASNNLNTGFIAQDVEKVIPEVVSTAQEKSQKGIHTKSINYSAVVPYLVESIKTLSNEVENLKNENEALKEKMKQYDLWFSELLNK